MVFLATLWVHKTTPISREVSALYRKRRKAPEFSLMHHHHHHHQQHAPPPRISTARDVAIPSLGWRWRGLRGFEESDEVKIFLHSAAASRPLAAMEQERTPQWSRVVHDDDDEVCEVHKSLKWEWSDEGETFVLSDYIIFRGIQHQPHHCSCRRYIQVIGSLFYRINLVSEFPRSSTPTHCGCLRHLQVIGDSVFACAYNLIKLRSATAHCGEAGTAGVATTSRFDISFEMRWDLN